MDAPVLYSKCLLVLIYWNIHVCGGSKLTVNQSCAEAGMTDLDNSPLTLRSMFDNDVNVESINQVLANGDMVRIEGYAALLPPFTYYGCYYHKLTEESVSVYPAFMDRLKIDSIDPTRPMYDCFQKCYTHYDGLFYLGLGFDRCLCTDDISIFYTFTMPDQTCEGSFKDAFKPIYKASSFYNIVVFKVDASSSNLLRTGLNENERFLKLYSFVVPDESGSVEKLYGWSFDNVFNMVCAQSNTQPTNTNETIRLLANSRKTFDISQAQSTCLENGMILASRDNNQINDGKYNGIVHLLGDFSFLGIYQTKPFYDNSCVVLEKKLGKIFIKQDNCSVLRPLICVVPNPRDEDVGLANYVIPVVSLFIVCVLCVSIFLIYKCRRNSTCKMCYKVKGHQKSSHRSSINVPGRMAGQTNTGSVNVPGRIAGQTNAGSVNVPGRIVGQTNTGSVNVSGRIAGQTNAASVPGNTTTDCVSSDGAVPGCNNIGQYCIETSVMESEEIEKLTPDLKTT